MYLNTKTYDRRCWICAEIANSDEHKFKKSDMISRYGKGDSNYSAFSHDLGRESKINKKL